MLRELFRIPGLNLPIYGYGVMVLCGVLAGLWVLRRGARSRGLDENAAVDAAIWMVLAGLVGARLFYCVQFWDVIKRESWLEPFKIWNGGLVLYGALIGGIAGYVIPRLLRGQKVMESLDLMAPAACVGVGFGRIGCLLNGCCWGEVCAPDFPLGITFPITSPPAQDPLFATAGPLHPVQIYLSIEGFLTAIVLYRLNALRVPAGVTLGCFALLHGTARFALENLRGDHHPAPGAWPVSQTISAGVVFLGIALVLWSLRRSRRAAGTAAAQGARPVIADCPGALP